MGQPRTGGGGPGSRAELPGLAWLHWPLAQGLGGKLPNSKCLDFLLA